MKDYGERLDIETAPRRFIAEHAARYAYAARFVAGRQVLDVAAGTGYGGGFLLNAGARLVVGVEIDVTALEIASRRRVPGQLFVRADAMRLPLGDGSLDACVSVETVEHVADPERFLSEIARVLRPGSPIVLTTPNRSSREIPHDNPYHVREFDPAELISLLADKFTISRTAGQYLASSGPRRIGRRWLSGSPVARLARDILPSWLRTYGGRSIAGAPDVTEVTDLVAATPATLIIVANRR